MALEDKFIIRRIQNHVDRGINSEDGDVTQVRQSMFSRYMGDLYGTEREGYSKFTTREVLQAVEWALPALMRIFLGGVRPVEFRPNGPADVDQAKHETEVVAYWFFEGEGDEGGFMALYSFLRDILMYPNGYVMVLVEEAAFTDTQNATDVTQGQLDALEEEEEITEIAITKEYTVESEMGSEQRFDISISKEKQGKKITVKPIPPDCSIIEHGHNALNLDSSPFVCIREQKTYSDLRKMGFSDADLEDLSPDDDETWNDEAVTRHFYEDELPGDEDRAYDIQADEVYWVHDCYMQIDVDEDGISEPRHIMMVGCRILENEPQDYMPVVAGSALPQAHKHIGMGYAELVADLQELMTTLTRQMLDNIYKQNVQRTYINKQAITTDNKTLDDMLDGESEVIVVRGIPAENIFQEQTTPIVAEIAQVIDQIQKSLPERTGVAPNISLDPDVLKKSTMGAFVGALDQASQRLELLARVIAESALRPVFQKIHYCLRTSFDEPQPIEVAGKWVTPQPMTWKRRPNMRVNVGLGFNNQQVMLMLLGNLLQIQKEAFTQGLADHKGVFSTLEKMVEHANLGHAQSFFVDPKQPGWKAPEPPKPAEMVIAEAQAKALEAEAARKGKEVDAKIAADAKELDAKIREMDESAKAKAAELNQGLMTHKLKVTEVTSKIAVDDATIQAQNAKGSEPGGADDEYARGEKMTGALNGGDKAKSSRPSQPAGE